MIRRELGPGSGESTPFCSPVGTEGMEEDAILSIGSGMIYELQCFLMLPFNTLSLIPETTIFVDITIKKIIGLTQYSLLATFFVIVTATTLLYPTYELCVNLLFVISLCIYLLSATS